MSIQRAIFGGFRQLGITEEDAQREIYSRVTGQSRLSLMTAPQQDAVMKELRRLGYKPVAVRRNGRRRLDGRYAPKMQSLWIAAYNLGIVEDREDRALEAFVQAPDRSGQRPVGQQRRRCQGGCRSPEKLDRPRGRCGVG